jgi:Mg-chelatase subunit ChlI
MKQEEEKTARKSRFDMKITKKIQKKIDEENSISLRRIHYTFKKPPAFLVVQAIITVNLPVCM